MLCSRGVGDLISGVERNHIVRADTKLSYVERKEAVRRFSKASKEV